MEKSFLYFGQNCEGVKYNYDKLQPGLYRIGNNKPETWNIKKNKWEVLNEK